MVGDDLETDVAGAHRAGLRGILVLSGKTDEAGFRAAERGRTPPRSELGRTGSRAGSGRSSRP